MRLSDGLSLTYSRESLGVLWGALFHGEAMNGGAMIGGVIVLIGMALVLIVLADYKNPEICVPGT